MTPKKIPEITLENYEEYLILSLDGELNSEEETALQAFLQAHPALAETMADYEAVKMPLPENMPVFEGKEALLKPGGEASRKTISFRPFLWAAAALLLLWGGIRFLPEDEKASQIAVASPQPSPKERELPVVDTPVLKAQAPVVASSSKPENTKSQEPAPKAQKPTSPSPEKAFVVAPQEEVLVATASPEEVIAPLPLRQEPPVLPATKPAAPEAPEVLAVVLPTPQKTPSSGIAVEVPVLEELRNAAAEKVYALRDARRSLKGTEATVSIANRPLFTIRF